MKRKLIKFLIWIAKKIGGDSGPSAIAQRVNDRVILPDHLSEDIVSMRIDFDKPISPMRVMENLDYISDIKNPLPEMTYTLYEVL